MRPVLSKADFVRRYQAGEFGNHSPTWDTPEELAKDAEPDALVHLRNRIAGGSTYYNIRAADAFDLWTEMGPQIPQWYCSAMAPTEHTIAQGEVMDGPWGLHLLWTFVKKPMREALTQFHHTDVGLVARMRLRIGMNDLSYEWFQYLLEAYPDHVIEFSIYDHCWGTVPGHNTVFWEVRKY